MKVLCYSVKLQRLYSITEQCYKAVAFNGSEALIPKSQVYGQDYEVSKSEAYWISAWILERKSIQYSSKKKRFFDSNTRRSLPEVTITKHVPEIISKAIDYDKELLR